MGKPAAQIAGAAGAGGIPGVGAAAGALGLDQSGALGSIGEFVGDPFGQLGAASGAGERQAAQNALIEELKGIETISDQTSTTGGQDVTTTDQTQTVSFGDAGAEELALRKSSIDAFNAQKALVGQQQQAIAGRADLQAGGRDVLGNITGGSAFDLTASEQQRIQALNQASVNVGQDRIEQFLNEKQGQAQADIARRGIRGQAAQQIQGDVIGEARQALTQQQLAANQVSAQQALDITGQRVGIQAGVGQGLADFQDVARQQAIANTATLQDPVALQQLRDERLRASTTQIDGTSTTDFGKTTNTSGTSTGGGVASAIGQLGVQPGKQETGIATALGIGEVAAKGFGAAAKGG